ncbi:MAG: FecR family protein [Nitrospira sp.]
MSTAAVMKSREDLHAEAAEWVVRLGGESATDEDRAACTRWKEQSPAHLAAFTYAERTWHSLTMLDAAQLPVTPSAVPLHGKRFARPSWIGLAACLAGLISLFILQSDALRAILMADYRTGSGEQRRILLPDGSNVLLNTASAIAVHFDEHVRGVQLLDGEALFMTAPTRDSETRPFVVTGRKSHVRAVGTQFIVRRLEHADEVTVIEHSVEVTADHRSLDLAPIIVEAGHRVQYETGTGPERVIEVNIEQATSWQRGRLLFDRMPLAEVIAEINRYRHGRIVIMNSELAARRVSGVVLIGKVDASLSFIASELGALTTSLTPFLTVLH